jgi:hypothetical protein
VTKRIKLQSPGPILSTDGEPDSSIHYKNHRTLLTIKYRDEMDALAVYFMQILMSNVISC